MSEQDGQETYRLIVEREFDPSSKSLPPGDLEEQLRYAAAHSGLPDETWRLVDDMGEVVAEHDV